MDATWPPVEDPLARLREAFSAPEPARGGGVPGLSGVLVPVVDVATEPFLLFTRRSMRLTSHAGEISFPGGRVDPADDGPLAAALRETEEEVGIRPDEVDLLGHVTDFRTFQEDVVCTYAGQVLRETPPVEPASTQEVDEVLYVPLGDLFATAGRTGPRSAADEDRWADLPWSEHVYRVRSYEAKVLVEGPRSGRPVHYWDLGDGTTIWGITGELLARFLTKAYGWETPMAPAPITDLYDFLPEGHHRRGA